MVIDTHAHLTDEIYTNVNDIIKNFNANNLSRVFCVAYDLESAQKCLELSKKHSTVYSIIGIHPTELELFNPDWLAWLEEQSVKNYKVIAIGEIGLDYHYPDTDKEKQKEVFIDQIKLADKLGLPIIIHERDAIEDVLKILTEYKQFVNNGGVFHCFNHDFKTYKKIEKLGYFVSFGGIITFKNAGIVTETVRQVPLSRIILETDCPYLAPVPYRGKVNEPKYVNWVAQKIAELKNIPLQEIEEQTNKNVFSLFKRLGEKC